MLKLADQYLSETAIGGGIKFVEGGKDTVQFLMKNYRFDLVFFTGGSVAGREIAKLAAEKLTPTIMEMGGKNPVLIDDLKSKQKLKPLDIAKRIIWSKTVNAGQICVSADYSAKN